MTKNVNLSLKHVFVVLALSIITMSGVIAQAPVPKPFPKNFMILPVFDRLYYLKANVDVATSGTEPLAHWSTIGFGEGRSSSPVFNVKYYLEANKDLADSFGMLDYVKATNHWLTTGIKEGRKSHPDYDPKFYAENNPDLYKQFGLQYDKLLDHYLNFGYKEGRKAAAPKK